MMQPEVIVYTLPDCPRCEALKRELEANELTYATVDLSTDELALDYVKNHLGFTKAPVFQYGEEVFPYTGPGQIADLLNFGE